MKMLPCIALCIVSGFSFAAGTVVSKTYALPDGTPLIYVAATASNSDGSYYALAQVVSPTDISNSQLALVRVKKDGFEVKHTFDKVYTNGGASVDTSALNEGKLFVASDGTVYGLMGYQTDKTYFFYSYSESTGYKKISNVYYPITALGELSDGTIYGLTRAYFTYKSGVFKPQVEIAGPLETKKYPAIPKINLDPHYIIGQSNGTFFSEKPISLHNSGYGSGETLPGNELYSFTISGNNITNYKLLHKFASTNGETKAGNGFTSPHGYNVKWVYKNKDGVLIGQTEDEGQYGYGTLFKIENGTFSVLKHFLVTDINDVKDISTQEKIVELKDGSILVGGRTTIVRINPKTNVYETLINNCPLCALTQVNADTALAITPYDSYYEKFWGKNGSIISYKIVDETTPPDVGTPSIATGGNSFSVFEGETVSFSWAATNVSSCIALNDWSGPKELSGTYTYVAAKTSQFALKCTNGVDDVYTNFSVNVTPKAEDPINPGDKEVIPIKESEVQKPASSSGGSISFFNLLLLAVLIVRRIKA